MEQITFSPFPNLTTERLTLRQLATEDDNDLFVLRSDEHVMKYIARPLYKNIEEAREKIVYLNNGIAKSEWIFWTITLKNDTKLIGTICLWNIIKEHYRAEVGFELHPNFQGKGLMQEALTAVLDYGFKDMGFHSIVGYVNPNNLSSIKLMERNNFVREAYFKEDVFFNRKFRDTAVYSLINPNESNQ